MMKVLQRLEGKVALITGAASGLGRATAAEFIRQGARSVILTDNRHDIGQQTAAELGPIAEFYPCDVTDESQVSAAVDHAVSRHGQLDILHNNAGIVEPSYPPSISQLDLAEFDRVMAVNVRGAVAGIKHAARVMIPRGKGCILCTASISGVLAGLGSHSYTVSKTALPGLVRSAAAELGRHGLRVNCISPFAVATPMVLEQLRFLYTGSSSAQIEEIIGRLGELSGARCEEVDVARAAVYLASEEAKYVSGHNLVVDGGFTCFKRLDFPAPPELERDK